MFIGVIRGCTIPPQSSPRSADTSVSKPETISRGALLKFRLLIWRNHQWLIIRGIGTGFLNADADDVEAVREAFRAFRWQTIGRQQSEREALRQRCADQRMGENDAWQVAVAECIDAIIVGHDPKAFSRLGLGYEDHRKTKP